MLSTIGVIDDGDGGYWAPSPRPVTVPTMWVGDSVDQVTIPGPCLGEFLSAVEPGDDAFSFSMPTFPVRWIGDSLARFETIAAVPAAVRACNAVLHAVAACEQFQFDQGLIFGWTACEVGLSLLWTAHLDRLVAESAVVLTAERRVRLERQPIAATAEHLLLAAAIDADLHSALDVARVERNRWVHGLRRVSYGAATSAIAAAQRLLGLATGCELDVHPVISSPAL